MNSFLKNTKGFTISELLTVIGILAIITTISLPFLRKFEPNLKLSASARLLAADLRYAQQLTVTEQAVYSVKFDLINNSYQLIRIDAATTTVKTVVLDSEVGFSQVNGFTDDRVVFNYYGAVSESGQITLVNINNKTAIINVRPSGYVQLD